jgi:hypothetical protein
MKFYPYQTYLTCGNGCDTKLQALTYDEEGNPVDVDWVELQRIYDEHNANCTPESPYTTDQNGFYGNPEDCYQNEGGYCEY